MKKHHIWFVIVVTLTVIIIFLYPKSIERPAPLINANELTTDSKNIANKKINPPPDIRYPIPQEPTTSAVPATEKQISQTTVKQTLPLPELEKSDSLILKTLSSLLESYPLQQLFRDTNMIPRIVVTVDNLPRKRISPAQLPTTPVNGIFIAEGDEGKRVLSKENFKRYEIYINMIKSIDQEKLVNSYFYMYPLFQQAYQQLGYQDAYFNDRLIETIDDLLKAPEILETIKLTRTSVMFKFAAPELEALSSGQKIMIRMGPENAQQVKNALTSIRELLVVSNTPEVITN